MSTNVSMVDPTLVNHLNPEQQLAVDLCTDPTKKIVCVTGPAGVGKTVIIKIIHDKLRAAGYNVILVAPTGKAAKRIREATGIMAMTIHMALEFTNPGEPDEKGNPTMESVPRRHEGNKLTSNVILADEYTMVNHHLHRCLLNAIPLGGLLRVFGDLNQLQPIEDAGMADQPSPFQSFITNAENGSKLMHVVRLTKSYRQAEGSGIFENCQRLLGGMLPKQFPDFKMINSDKPLNALYDYLEKTEGGMEIFTQLDNQIITPMNKGPYGAYKGNAWAQNVFERSFPSKQLELPRHRWNEKMPVSIRIGSKVVNGKNVYPAPEYRARGELDEFAVFNGEVGTVVDIDWEYESFVVDVGDRQVVVPPAQEVIFENPHTGGTEVRLVDPRRDWSLAYMITTHKAQGSEYNKGCYILHRSMSRMTIRANIYTGWSRFRHHLLVMRDESIAAAVRRIKMPGEK